ncbi:MAG: hypothetical protein GXO32_08285 [Crenarchaeota archaeon]|nr:hypothetical protein [Thermoproteota archaeon]
MRALFVGNLTIDVLDNRVRVGGSGFYGGVALSEYLGVETYVLSSASEKYGPLFRSVLSTYGIKLLEVKCHSVATFRISGRKMWILDSGCCIPKSSIDTSISVVRPDILLLTPVFKELAISDSLEVLSSFNGVKAVDLQGFVRERLDSRLACVWREQLKDVVMNSTVVHGNIKEFCIGADAADVMRWLRDYSKRCSALILASLDEKGCYAAYRGRVYLVPAPPTSAIDDVGAGDILTAVAAYYLAQGVTPLEAACRGVAAASLKVENPYSAWFDRESIDTVSKSLLHLIKEIV